MLKTCHAIDGAEGSGTPSLDGARWIDLCDPTAEEIASVAAAFGIAVPTRESLAEIEASSRTRAEGDAVYLSAPLIGKRGEDVVMAPTGFVLMPDRLVTIRFAAFGAFDTVHETVAQEGRAVSAPEIMVRLLEEIVDRSADRLERVAETLADASRDIFSEPEKDAKRHKVGRETRRLRALMVKIGRSNEDMVRVRHSFLAIGRIAGFLAVSAVPKGEGLRERLKTVRRDIDSLDEFENSMAGRVSLLLDAATGFISIEQNDVVKVLTVVSVAGVPPVVIAGIYGMNFKYMPELDWHTGYPLALLVMLVTTALPVLWFKWRDWL